MGEVSRGFEDLTPGQRDQSLADYNASPEVSAAHEYVQELFHDAEVDDQLNAEHVALRERIEETIRDVFYLASEINELIERQPEAARLELRQRRTEQLAVIELKTAAEGQPKPNYELIELRAEQAKAALENLLVELEGRDQTSNDTHQAQ